MCQALHEGGIAPDWIVGTSAGAINGAILAGNAPGTAVLKLAAFWRPDDPDWWQAWPEDWRRTIETSATLLGGRPGLFGPIGTALFACSGGETMPQTLPLATRLARRGGKVIIVGGFDDGDIARPLEWQRIRMSEITLTPAQASPSTTSMPNSPR